MNPVEGHWLLSIVIPSDQSLGQPLVNYNCIDNTHVIYLHFIITHNCNSVLKPISLLFAIKKGLGSYGLDYKTSVWAKCLGGKKSYCTLGLDGKMSFTYCELAANFKL